MLNVGPAAPCEDEAMFGENPETYNDTSLLEEFCNVSLINININELHFPSYKG